MEHFKRYDNTKVTRDTMHAILKAGEFTPEAAQEAFETAEIYPSKNRWLMAVDRFLLAIGAVFMLCGVIFFFAYNWADIDKFAKLGIVQGSIIVLGIVVLLRKKLDFPAQIAVTAIAILVGALLALYGQTYQTGADAWMLFAEWSLLIIPLGLLSRFPPLWFVQLVLANITLWLYNKQQADWDGGVFIAMYAVSALAVAIWELVIRPKNEDTQRWWPRIVSAFAVLVICFQANACIFEDFDQPEFVAAFFIAIATFLVGIPLYLFKLKDLFVLATLWLGVISMATCGTAKFMIELGGNDDGVTLLVSGIVSIMLTTGIIAHLIVTNKKWREAA